MTDPSPYDVDPAFNGVEVCVYRPEHRSDRLGIARVHGAGTSGKFASVGEPTSFEKSRLAGAIHDSGERGLHAHDHTPECIPSRVRWTSPTCIRPWRSRLSYSHLFSCRGGAEPSRCFSCPRSHPLSLGAAPRVLTADFFRGRCSFFGLLVPVPKAAVLCVSCAVFKLLGSAPSQVAQAVSPAVRAHGATGSDRKNKV